MKHYILGGGTVICSVLAFHSWTMLTTPEDDSPPCDTSTSPSTSDSSRCMQKSFLGGIRPERLLNLNWSDRATKPLPDTVEASYQQALQTAQSLANQDQFELAIAAVSGVPKNSRHYEPAQQLQEDWARALVRQAVGACQQAQVTQAIALLKGVPAHSQAYAQAAQLRQNWTQQARIWNRAIAAQNAGDWQTAVDAIRQLEGSAMYQSLMVQQVLQRSLTNLYEPDPALVRLATNP
jgi:hypothetical protein